MGIGIEFNSRPSEAELLQKCRDGKEFTVTVLGRINFSDKRYGEGNTQTTFHGPSSLQVDAAQALSGSTLAGEVDEVIIAVGLDKPETDQVI